jgi:hypothetical protein
VPACSSGEEAYSLAMVFREALELHRPEAHFTLQIYATDLDRMRSTGRGGRFIPTISSPTSRPSGSRHFVPEDQGYRVNKDIREMVVFAVQNVISDPPFTKLDLLSCRNLLIYFGPELQKKLHADLPLRTQPQGLLVLGSAETVSGFTDLFSPLDKKIHIFRAPRARLRAPSGWTSTGKDMSDTAPAAPMGVSPPDFRHSLEYQTDQLIQQNYAPAAVLVNGDGDILYISGRTGKYLEPAAGKVNMNIHAMARDGLRDALPGVIRNALHQSQPIHLNGLQVEVPTAARRLSTSRFRASKIPRHCATGC